MSTEKNLEQLEGDIWDEPKIGSHLATECHKLRKIPLKDLSADNLRMLMGQRMGLKFIVPLVLDILESNLLAEGSMYKGDLLVNLLRIEPAFWCSNPELNNRVVELKIDIESIIETLQSEVAPNLGKFEFR